MQIGMHVYNENVAGVVGVVGVVGRLYNIYIHVYIL